MGQQEHWVFLKIGERVTAVLLETETQINADAISTLKTI